MPADRDQAKRDAELAVEYRNRLKGRGLSEQEIREYTVAWILSRRVELPEPDEREPWEKV